MLNILSGTRYWPALRSHLVLLTAGWMAFCMLIGLLGAFHQMEVGGKEVASRALIQAGLLSVTYFLIGIFVMITAIALIIKSRQ